MAEGVSWFPLSKEQNSYDVLLFYNIGWSIVLVGSSYTFRIRAIGQNESQSNIVEHTWVAE